MKSSARNLMKKMNKAPGRQAPGNMSSPALGFTDSNPDKHSKSPRIKNIMSKLVKK